MKLVFSSLLFLSNFIHNTYYQTFVYAWLFLLLTVTSVFIHSEIFIESHEMHHFILLMDKMVIMNIFFYGLYLYWNSGVSIIPIISVILVTLLYTRIYNSTNKDCETIHTIMHIIGCVGHHFIIHDYGIFMELEDKKKIMKHYLINKMQMDAEFWGMVFPALVDPYNVIDGY
jgi:hypothetical protein